jgi:putative endonuclease
VKEKSSGAWGEDLALRYLTRRGFQLVKRNYRTRYGEIDLILRKDDLLVFVEVKLRRGTGFGNPLEAVTLQKQTTLRSLDVFGILVDGNEVRVSHVEDAF